MLALCIFFFSVILINECKILDGYEFPVYSADFCPRNRNEMEERSSAISCKESDYYMCIPDEKFINLLEFCYVQSSFTVPKDVCCFLSKRSSRVDTYNCTNFKHGCPNDTYNSNQIYEKPICLSIENGCFAADQSCTGLNSIMQSTSTLPGNESSRSLNSEKREKSDFGTSTFLEARDMAEKYTILLYTMTALVPLSGLVAIVLIVYCRKKRDTVNLGKGNLESIPTYSKHDEGKTDRTKCKNAICRLPCFEEEIYSTTIETDQMKLGNETSEVIPTHSINVESKTETRSNNSIRLFLIVVTDNDLTGGEAASETAKPYNENEGRFNMNYKSLAEEDRDYIIRILKTTIQSLKHMRYNTKAKNETHDITNRLAQNRPMADMKSRPRSQKQVLKLILKIGQSSLHLHLEYTSGRLTDASVTRNPYAGNKGRLIINYKRSAEQDLVYLTAILKIAILFAEHNADMIKPKIGTHDSNHTNSHEEDDVDLLNMACQQELEERQQLLPDKSNLQKLHLELMT